MSTAVKRACDACHRRKVKCDGVNPCRNCSASQLTCTYNAIPQKKGPKGSRAKVITELRETQRQTSMTVKLQSRMMGLKNGPPSPTLSPTPGLLTSEVVKAAIDFYFDHMYPIMPILQRQHVEQALMFMDASPDTYCLLTSLCALMQLQPGMTVPSSDPFSIGAGIASATMLMDETIRVRKSHDYLESPTLNTLCTSYFLFACHSGVEMHEKAWFYLREATTLMHMIEMHKEATYVHWDVVEGTRRRRLFWLLYVTERAYALKHQRPLSLQATINPPTTADDHTDPLAHKLVGFVQLVMLFRPFDDALVSLWNQTQAECLRAPLNGLQKQAQEIHPGYLNDPQALMCDMPVNQQWLKDTCWKLSMANGNNSDASMNFPSNYIEMARGMLPMVASFPHPSQGLRGLELMDKLFTVACPLFDYLSTQPASRVSFAEGPRERLYPLLRIVTLLRHGDFRFLPLLLTKTSEVLPTLIRPILPHAPDNVSLNLGNIDIFDGFGNAGMAQQSYFSAESYEDNKFAAGVLMEEHHVSPDGSGSNGSAPTSNDMNSSFGSSPPIMSPGVEMPHGLPPADYNSMSDMVISPMSQAPNSSLHTPNTMTMGGQPPPQHPHLQHPQHPQHSHHPMPTFPNTNHHVQNVNSKTNQPPNISINTQNLHPLGLNMNQPIRQGMSGDMDAMSMNGAGMLARQPQRANSFAMAPPHMQTVGDFHAIQRANSDLGNLGSLGPEIDFNSLSR